MIRSVVFDVGETLVDDTREWARWAQWIGVPSHTFSAVMGAVTASGQDNADTFRVLRPGFDVAVERQRREDAGCGECIEDVDLYSDVRSGLGALRSAGFWVGIAGNQTVRAGECLRDLCLPVDEIATSGEWGVAKPDRAFFDRVIAMAAGCAQEIVYVGDHRDQDVVPASNAGLRVLLVRRGPWGHLWSDHPDTRARVEAVIDSLTEIPDRVSRMR